MAKVPKISQKGSDLLRFLPPILLKTDISSAALSGLLRSSLFIDSRNDAKVGQGIGCGGLPVGVGFGCGGVPIGTGPGKGTVPVGDGPNSGGVSGGVAPVGGDISGAPASCGRLRSISRALAVKPMIRHFIAFRILYRILLARRTPRQLVALWLYLVAPRRLTGGPRSE
jgi:hypothetical protein